MNQPPLEKMLQVSRSKYALVVIAAKRARQIAEAGIGLIQEKGTKPVTIALHEIAGGRIKFKFKS
ncbi:MAG TPA: DNA-directed RNA polymerase subunit omega [Peptococcaceae bacterium]|nr:MAG: DNA-directed RNA polymerase subunit omega [Clostridia bacterium 41_269]HBT20060.1 DNA-directed RNA polymerase subunit omega [Peptococcaceae bacterium]